MCQAVRALGVKWTLLAETRVPADGVAIVSMNTVPVNQSLGPEAVCGLFVVICMAFSVALCGSMSRRSADQERTLLRGERGD
jgi:hypothetical protein